MMRIDLNANPGESFGPWALCDDAQMMSIVTSANIANGGDASDPDTMYRTLALARDNGPNLGAHPGCTDREGSGRRVIPMSPDEIGRICAAQIGALMGISAQVGLPVRYVKPRGALGNMAVHSVGAHGGSAGALGMAREIRKRLTAHGVQITKFLMP